MDNTETLGTLGRPMRLRKTFFRNACTKSGSLRFSQFSGCWL